MHPRQTGPAPVTAANPMLTPHTHTISHAGPPGGTPMGYPQGPYANTSVPPGNVNSMGGLNPTTMMGPSGQPGILASYGHVARAGPQMGVPNGGVPGHMVPMGAGRGNMVAMPPQAQQPNMAVRYGPTMMRTMPNGMSMPTTMMAGMGRGGGAMPPMGMAPRPVQRLPQSAMQPHPGMAPGQPVPPGSQVPPTHFQPGQPTMGPMGVPQRVIMGQPTAQPQFAQQAGATPSAGMGAIQMGMGAVNSMAPGSSPVRNPSPHSASASAAATPGNAPTPGGRPVQKPPTPVNAATPFNPANAPTPITRPGTATHPQAPLSFRQTTPRMQHAEAMQSLHQGSPHNPARGTAMTPSGVPPGGLPVNTVFRPTPSEMVQQQTSELYGIPPSGLPPGSMSGQPPPGGPGPGPMEGVRYATMPPGMHQPPQQPLQRPPQAPGQPTPLQPQLTGGSMQGVQPMPLAPQHTGGSIQGAQPLVPQHTGGSVQGAPGEMMMGAAGPGPVPGRASVPPSTPRNVVVRPPGMSFSGAPPMGVGPGPVSMGAPPHIMGPPMGMTMVPPGMGSMAEMRPPPGPHPMRGLPMEVNEIGMNVATMPPGPRRHNFGVLRLLQFSSQLGNINERKSDFWSSVIANNFTDTATLSIRSHKDTGLKLNSFVEVPFALLTRFFLTLSQSRVHRMSFVLDGAIETQEGQDYVVYCRHAKWPMYYENGYVIELTGVLRATCKVVPMLPAGFAIPAQSSPSGPEGTAAAPAKPNTASPHTNSPANNTTSPNPNNPNADLKVHNSAYKVPYIVKIDELSFDSEMVFKYVNVACIFKRPSTDPNEDIRIPEEPGNIYGIPVLTMRVIEFIEGSQALEPVMEHFGDESKKGASGPIEAMESLVKAFPPGFLMPHQHQPMFAPTKPQVLGVDGRIFPPTPPIPFLSDLIKVEDGGYNMDPEGAHLNGDDSSAMQVDAAGMASGIPPGVTVVQPSLTVMATPGSTSAPTASPTITTKTAGKKQAPPDSPTKSTTSEKDKAPKRRNTTENTDGPPSKRTRTQGRKPSRA